MGYMGSYCNMPKTIFYRLKGDYKCRVRPFGFSTALGVHEDSTWRCRNAHVFLGPTQRSFWACGCEFLAKGSLGLSLGVQDFRFTGLGFGV